MSPSPAWWARPRSARAALERPGLDPGLVRPDLDALLADHAVGLLIARGIFDTRVFVAVNDRALFTPSSMWYAGAAFVAALVATGLLFLLLVATAPAPFSFFSWIVGVATAIAVIVPFTTNAVLESKIATAAIDLALGLTLLSILPAVGRSAPPLGATPD